MIRHTSLQRLGRTIVCGAAGAFAMIGVVANLIGGNLGDALWLTAFVALMAAMAGLYWIRFVSPDDSGIAYRNWLLVHAIPWAAITEFRVRRLLAPRTSAWAVVVHRRHGLPVTLRATGRSGRSRSALTPGRVPVEQIAEDLEAMRAGAVPG